MSVYVLFLHFVLSFVAIPILWVVGLLPKSAYEQTETVSLTGRR